MAQHIQLRRGTAADLPTGGTIEGEPRFALDTGILYIDDGTNNVYIGGGATVVPETFNAIGDGVTDDTTAIQAALDAIPSTGGTVKLGSKTYLFTNLIITKANTTIEGSGWGSIPSTTMAADANTAPAIWVKASGVTLKNFKATWKTLPTTDQYGSSIEENDVVAVGWLTVTGGQPVITKTVIDGIYVYGGKQHGISVGWSNDTSIRNCRVEEVYGTGIFPYETTNIKITDNFVYRSKDAGIDIQSSTTSYADNAVISNNIIQSTSIGIGSHGGRNVTISDNVIDNTWAGAIYCQPSTYYGVGEPTLTSITGNVIRRPFQFYGAGNFHADDRYTTIPGTLAHIEVLSTSDVVIANNLIDDDSDLHTHYMTYVNGRKVTFTGNTITSDGSHGLYFGKQGTPDSYTDITSLTVTGNNISISSGNGSLLLGLLGVATGIISGNYFDCGGQAAASPLGRFLVGAYAKDVLVTGNRIVNYTDFFTDNGNSVRIVCINNSGALDYMTTSTTANIESAAHAINTANKVLGTTIFNTTTNRIVVASGAVATDTWCYASGVTAHTPS